MDADQSAVPDERICFKIIRGRLPVAPEYRGADYGERLLEACEERARELRLKRMFVLAITAVHWFRLHGFAPATVAALPARRQSLYNYQRNSKVLVKKL